MEGTAEKPYEVEQLFPYFPKGGEGLPLPESHSLYQLLCVIATNNGSGVLEMTVGEQTASFFVRKGDLLGIEPFDTSFDERFAETLVKGEFVEPERLKEALAIAQAKDRALALVLYEKKAVALDVMGRELKAMKAEMFQELLALPAPVAYRFTARPRFKRKFDPVRLHLGTMVLEFVRGQLKKCYAKHIEPLLEEHRFKYAQMNEDGAMSVEVLSLSDKERHATRHILHGPNRLNEAYSLCLMTRHGTARLIMVLHHLGLLNWLEEAGEVEGEETVEDMLRREIRNLDGQDHFARLEVHWATHPTKLDRAIERHRMKYGPGSKLAGFSDEARDLCATILETLEESHRYLSNKRQRRQYRMEVQGERRIRIAADFLVKQADLNMFRSEWDAAFELIESALDLIDHPSISAKLAAWRQQSGRR